MFCLCLGGCSQAQIYVAGVQVTRVSGCNHILRFEVAVSTLVRRTSVYVMLSSRQQTLKCDWLFFGLEHWCVTDDCNQDVSASDADLLNETAFTPVQEPVDTCAHEITWQASMHDFLCTCTTVPSCTFELSKRRTHAVHRMIGSSLPTEISSFTKMLQDRQCITIKQDQSSSRGKILYI